MKKIKSVLIVIVISLILSSRVMAVSNNPMQSADSAPVPYGTVYATAIDATGRTYIGGNFSHVGSYTGNGIIADASTGALASVYPKVNGPVMAAASDGAGGWYIGGAFTRVGDVSRTRLAHILSDGSVDPDWTPAASASVNSIVVSGTGASAIIYLGGDFVTVTPQGSTTPSTTNRIAALTSTGSLLSGFTYPCNINDTVKTLFLQGSTLYVGGKFSNVSCSSTTFNRIISFNATSGSVITSFAPNLEAEVNDIVSDGTYVYVAGLFASKLARFNPATGIVDSAWIPAPDQPPTSLALSGGNLYVGGFFNRIGGQSRTCLASLSTSSGAVTVSSWAPYLGSRNGSLSVYNISISGTRIFVTGNFSAANSSGRSYVGALLRHSAASFELSGGALTSWNPNLSSFTNHFALTSDGTHIYMGGTFNSAGAGSSQARSGFALINSDGSLDESCKPSFTASLDLSVYDIALDGAYIYVGGSFDSVTIGSVTTSRQKIARLNASDCSLDAWYPGNLNDSVESILVRAPYVYFSGSFSRVGTDSTYGGAARMTIAGSLDTTWKPLFESGYDVKTMSLSEDGSLLFAGGNFTTVNSSAQPNFAVIDSTPTSTGVLSPVWIDVPKPNNLVYSIVHDDTELYIGGGLTAIGAGPALIARSYLAAYTLSTASLDTVWVPSLVGSQVSDMTLSADGDRLLVVGQFSALGGAPHFNFGAISTTDTGTVKNWSPNFSVAMGGSVATDGSIVTLGGNGISDVSRYSANESFARFAIPSVSFASAASSTPESASALIPLTLSVADPDPITVSYMIADGTTTSADYTASSSVVIPSGSTTANINIRINDDYYYEPSETMTLSFSDVGGAAFGSILSHTLTINDNDPPPTISFNITGMENFNENAGVVDIKVRASSEPHQNPITVLCETTTSGTATVGSDFLATSTTLTFTSDINLLNCSIPIIDDTLQEGNETVNLRLSGVTGGASLGTSEKTFIINANDSPQVSRGSGGSSESGGASETGSGGSMASGGATVEGSGGISSGTAGDTGAPTGTEPSTSSSNSGGGCSLILR
ncbi:MAG: hypothetical protein IPJ69_13805 [Deltaproteobacteria bacterium]|nr:MAG: hypothetical protein IPJ69_13805 [Deltaproteobacteria bacterium]